MAAEDSLPKGALRRSAHHPCSVASPFPPLPLTCCSLDTPGSLLPAHSRASACAIPSALEAPRPGTWLGLTSFCSQLECSSSEWLTRPPQQGAPTPPHPPLWSFSPSSASPVPSPSPARVTQYCQQCAAYLHLPLTQESKVCEGKAGLLHC